MKRKYRLLICLLIFIVLGSVAFLLFSHMRVQNTQETEGTEETTYNEELLNAPMTDKELEIWTQNVEKVKEVPGYFIGGRPKAIADACLKFERIGKMPSAKIISAERYRRTITNRYGGYEQSYTTIYLHIITDDNENYYFNIDTGGVISVVWKGEIGGDGTLLFGYVYD